MTGPIPPGWSWGIKLIRQLVSIMVVLQSQVGNIGIDHQLASSDALDQFGRRKLRPVLVDILSQPTEERIETALPHLCRNLRVRFQRPAEEHCAHDVPQCVALEDPANAKAVPVDILEA